MSFHEVRFPEKISYGARGGPKFKTNVVTLGSGYEKRNIEWSKVRCEYDVAHTVKQQDAYDDLLEFFYARQGRAYGFRFKDWSDYVLSRQTIGTGDGATVAFQIFKRYTSGAVTYDRTITKIVAGTYTVWSGGVELTEGVGYTIDVNTGIITLTSAPSGGSPADTVEVSCQFDVPVRFDVDHLDGSIDFYDVYSWNQIPLVEVRDIS